MPFTIGMARVAGKNACSGNEVIGVDEIVVVVDTSIPRKPHGVTNLLIPDFDETLGFGGVELKACLLVQFST